MSDSPGPNFQNPPVAEVALGVYFIAPLGVRAAQMGHLWDRWRDRYPKTDDQPPLPPVVPETFPSPPMAMSIQLTGGFPGLRVRYLSESGDRVVQVQQDRLVLNWRRTPGSEEYPRYRRLRPELETALKEFEIFLHDEGLVLPPVSQAEVTYVNPIPMAALGEQRDLGRLIAPWSGENSDAFLPMPEDARIDLRYPIPHPTTGEPVGRLYVQGAPAVHQPPGVTEAEQVYMLQLFARGRPLGTDLQGAVAFLDLGHDWVVNGFTSLTTRRMHDEWRGP